MPLDLPRLLSYGAMGLGCILAVLAYFLLRREQDQPEVRNQLVTAIYAYLAFALILAALGFGSEIYRDKEKHSQKDRIAALQAALSKSRDMLLVLLDQKDGKVARLTTYDPTDPQFPRLLTDLKTDLRSLDSVMRTVLPDSN